MEETTDSSPEQQSEEVRIEVVVRGARSPLPYAADTVILRFAPTGRLHQAELRRGTGVVETVRGSEVQSLRAVGGNMTVQIVGPGDRRKGPFKAEYVKTEYPPATQPTTGFTLLSGGSRSYIVEVFNHDLRVWTREVEEP